jgi:hypothetical protein
MEQQLDRPVAYKISAVPFPDSFGALPEPFRVFESANGWWMDSGKVYALLFAFSRRLTIKEACFLADISLDQYKYFVSLHSDFSTLKERFESFMIIQAMNTICVNLDNPNIAMKFLDRTGYFKEKSRETEEELMPKEQIITQEQIDHIARVLEEATASVSP